MTPHDFPDLQEYEFIEHTRMGKLNRFCWHFRCGLEEGYPICCILRFSIETALLDGKTQRLSDLRPTKRRPRLSDGKELRYVPCRIFHFKIRFKKPETKELV